MLKLVTIEEISHSINIRNYLLGARENQNVVTRADLKKINQLIGLLDKSIVASVLNLFEFEPATTNLNKDIKVDASKKVESQPRISFKKSKNESDN